MIVVGIDPGVTGGIAWLHTEITGGLCQAEPMPVLDKRVQANQIADLLKEHPPDVIVIEDLHAMPRGSIASFSLGYSMGVAVATAQTLRHPLIRMRPTEWKKIMGLTKKDKSASLLLATELWPNWQKTFALKKNDGLAEAALIAEAYRRKEGL